MTTGMSLKHRVYYAARDGMAITLYAFLQDKTHDEILQILSQVVEDDGQKCTPLIIAAKNGHENVVRTLYNISLCKINLEQDGSVKFDGHVIEGASPLWCAAGAGHLNVVKFLIKCGANVNHPTKTNSTPVRAACFDGRLDIVKYLTDHDANVNMANKYNNTCLMIAAYKGHREVVDYLLEIGANPNEKAHCGATALHFSAESGHEHIVRALLDHGAIVSVINEHGMDALIIAAERTRAEVVAYFLTRPEITNGEKVDALELIGASYANDKDNYSLELAYDYLHRAMVERYCDPENVLRKQVLAPIQAYDNWVECQTLEELESIRVNHNALHMESLVIRERILGSHNPEVPHPIIYRGAVFADNAKFDRCIDLWLHALRLKLMNRIAISKDLLRFAQVFCQMIHVGVDLPFATVEEVLSSSITELERNADKIKNPGPKDDGDQLLEEQDSNLTTVLYLLVIMSKVMKGCSVEDIHRIHRRIFHFVNLDIATKDGQTPLHLAVNPETPVDEFHTVDVCSFPCAETTKILIQCGANVNEMDKKRNTPLHIIVGYHKPISDFLTLHSIIMSLVDSGAHMDVVNTLGETPFEAATTGVAEIILRTQSRLSLKCIAAKAVNKFQLTYQGTVPVALEHFIQLHGTGTSQG